MAPTRETAAGRQRWTIRSARPADLDALAAIVAADPRSNWVRNTVAGELDTEWAHVDVLTGGAGEILGFLDFWHVADELQLLYIATHPHYQRRGVGRRLMEHLCARARALSVAVVTLEVGAGNSVARALYESMAFAEVGRRPAYYASSNEDAILMTWEVK
jgi:ribosomal-protein-alanine N-acetyltransferase